MQNVQAPHDLILELLALLLIVPMIRCSATAIRRSWAVNDTVLTVIDYSRLVSQDRMDVMSMLFA
jgi:hypothetical protein